IIVAATTAASRGPSNASCFLPITSSIRNLVDAGNTSPESRLMIIRTNPAASSVRRGRTSSHISGQRSFSRSDPDFLMGMLDFMLAVFGWFQKKREAPSSPGPVRHRVKTYSAATGFVYQYVFAGQRPRDAGVEYSFDVQRTGSTQVRIEVLVTDAALAGF